MGGDRRLTSNPCSGGRGGHRRRGVPRRVRQRVYEGLVGWREGLKNRLRGEVATGVRSPGVWTVKVARWERGPPVAERLLEVTRAQLRADTEFET